MSGWVWPGATITRVVDGDTIDARVTRDMGFGGVAQYIVRLRLNRINTAPAYTESGKAATAFVTAWASGQVLSIETLKAYKYGGPDTSPGEWMAEVTGTTGGNLSDALVTQSLAVYWDGQGVRPGG